MDDEDIDALEKQLGIPHLSDHVPRALQGPGGPAKLLKACYADEIRALLAHLDPKHEGNCPNRAECEDAILQIWAKVSEASRVQFVIALLNACLSIWLND